MEHGSEALAHWLTMGLGEAWHWDSLETQVCCSVHQKQGQRVDRQLVQLEDRSSDSAPTLPWPCRGPDPRRQGHRACKG